MSDDKKLESLHAHAAAAHVADTPVKLFMSKIALLVPEGTKIYSAIQMLAVHSVGAAPVINNSQKIVGVISEHDLLLQTATRDLKESIEFTKDPVTVGPDTPLKDALVLLFKKRVRRLPVVDNGTVIGVVTRMDVLSRLINKGRK